MKISEFSFEDLNFYDRENILESVSAEDVLVPSHMDICIGDAAYTKLESGAAKYWSAEGETGPASGAGISVKSAISAVIGSGDAYTEEITAQQYEDVMEFVSVKAVFDYYLPYRDYCSLLGTTNPVGSEMISEISEIGFSSGSVDSLFVYDGAKDKYYRIVSDYSAQELLDGIYAAALSENTTYYPLESYVGEDLKQAVLVPAFLEADLSMISAAPDAVANNPEAYDVLARSFFAGTFDFVRKIQEESGRTTYMYGYGEKLLTIDVDGKVEYKAETSGTSSIRYIDALQLALAFVQEQGGFVTADGTEMMPYLSDAEAIDGGYRFKFGVMLGDDRIYYDDGDAIKADVINGQLSYFSRQFVEFSGSAATGAVREAHSSINVLAQNYEYMFSEIMEYVVAEAAAPDSGQQEDEALIALRSINTANGRFDYVVSLIDDMGYGYVYIPEDGALMPCYRISFANGMDGLYFDLYTAEPLESDIAVGIAGV